MISNLFSNTSNAYVFQYLHVLHFLEAADFFDECIVYLHFQNLSQNGHPLQRKPTFKDAH